MCNIHINDYYSNYFGDNDSNFIHCDFTIILLYDITLADVTINVSCLKAVYKREFGSL